MREERAVWSPSRLVAPAWLAALHAASVVVCGCSGSTSEEQAGATASSSSGAMTGMSGPTSTSAASRGSAATTTSSADTTAGSSATLATDPDATDSTSTGGEPGCPLYDEGVDVGQLGDPAISEASGLAVSRAQSDIAWVHNDSGNPASVFAMSGDGAVRAEYALQGVSNDDWEDLALGPGPQEGVDYLYIGDIGDNNAVRKRVSVLRLREPTVPAGSVDALPLDNIDILRFEYADGPHNAETLLVDPVSGDLYVVTKESTGPSFVFHWPAPHDPDEQPVLESVGSLAFGGAQLPGVRLTTAGDVSADGSLVAVRTYTNAFVWRRPPGQPLHAAFETEPCPVPLRVEIQGETFAFDAVDGGYFTVSEGTASTLWRFGPE